MHIEPNYEINGQYISGSSKKEYWEKHKASLTSIEWTIENDSFFRVPLLDKIGILYKTNFADTVDKLFENAYNRVPGLKLFVKRLSEVFIESDSLTFLEFFKQREKEWTSNIFTSKDSGMSLYDNDKDWLSIEDNSTLKDEFWFMMMEKLTEPDFCEIIKTGEISFPLLLTSLTIVGQIIGLGQDLAFSKKITIAEGDEDWSVTHHRTIYFLWEEFRRYINERLKKALIPSWCGGISYVGSSRIDVKRLYILDSKTDFTALLNRYFNTRRDFVGLKEYENKKGYEPDAFMNKWLYKFGVCDYATLDLDPDGLGVNIKLHKGDRTSLLADEGYGITQLFSILMEIETCIQNAFHHFLVRYGQNYVYVTDMNTNKVSFLEQTIIIEEPEIHLHPKFQSLLVDMFAEAKEKYNIHFIIETHSEYLIRRLQVRVAEKKISTEDVSVIYVDENSHPYNMGLKENGKFSQDFGPGFLDEADSAAIQLFDLNSD